MSDEKLHSKEEISKPLNPKEEETANQQNNVSVEENTEEVKNPVSEGEKKTEPDTVETAMLDEAASNEEKTKDAKEEIDSSEKNKEKETSEQENNEGEDDDDDEIASSDDNEEEDEHSDDSQKDYSTLSKKQLVSEFENLLKNKPIQEIKNDIEEIRSEFNSQFNEEQDHKKEEFLAEGGNIIDFYYTTPLKKQFSSLLFDYKEKRNNHYKNLKKDLQANLNLRQELIEELKGLLNDEENINTTYKHFKDIQARWHVAGAIPRDKYNIVWNTYHHHVENFYDFLHLNREFRDLDFKHNLEQKLKLILRAEELAQEDNINKAFRELQMLHKMWKEDIGPVAKEYREDVWDKFSEATKVIHDKRQESLKELEQAFETNFETKKELVEQITQITQNTKPSHQAWQNAIKNVQQLRDTYFATGRVPRSRNKEIWNALKDATRDFNSEKNAFYKNQKKEQFNNLEKKQELIEIANANKDSDDFDVVTSLMKKIQSDWKKIGHVPRKESDKIWKQFKGACNHYFDRLHAQKNEDSKEELANYEAKNELLESLSKLTLTGDHKADLQTIKEKLNQWKEIGKVPYSKRNIDRDFNKVLDTLFGKLDLDKKETELIKFDNKLNTLANREDDRKLKNEHFFISKKIEETKHEIRQLENNLGFFQNVDSNNPLVKEVHKNIDKHKEHLEVWKAKLAKIKSVREV